MATVLTGNDGAITLPDEWGSTAKVSSWSASFARATMEITGMGDPYSRRALGVLDITGSAAMHLAKDAANSRPAEDLLLGSSPTGRTLLLICSQDPDGGGAQLACSYSFTALVTNMGVSVDKNGDQIATFDFAISGGSAPTVTWDES